MATAISHALARRKSSPAPLELCTVAALVFVSAWSGIALAHSMGRIATIWVANAILLGFTLKHSRRNWTALLVAGCLANIAADLASGDSITAAIAFSLANLVEILTVAAPLRALKLHRDFARPISLLVFYALAVGPAPAISALLAASYFKLALGQDFVASALNWYACDALGLAIVVPVLLTVRLDALKAMFRKGQILTTAMLIGALTASIVINFFAREYPLAFLFYPAVLLLTFQRGFEGGAIGLAMSGAYMLFPVLVGDVHSTMRGHTEREQIIIVQIFIAVIGFSVVIVGAALEERRKLERGLATAIRRAESSREEALVAKEAAEKANRMKSMFLATMSHELRTPLNAVIGFSDVMHSEMLGPLGDPRYREYTTLIHDAGQHLLDLINDILDMSKIESGRHELNRERLDARGITRDCVEMMRERASQGGVALEAELPKLPLWLNADPRAMKQILLNLISNAVKFTPPGGQVTVSGHDLGNKILLSVRDTGIGIPADQIYRLGNPFVQLRNNAGKAQAGTGLGLALVSALAEMHDGSFRIESVENVGTTVSVEIPSAHPGAKAA